MAVEIRTHKLPSDEDKPEVKHAREIDKLNSYCMQCKLRRPDTPTKDCAVRIKLVVEDSNVAWRNKYLFFDDNGICKMFAKKDGRR